jgi:hypothetical protein
MQRDTINLPAQPIGFIEAIARGFFDVAAKAWPLVLPPLLLDLLLWLGPRLSIRKFALPIVDDMVDAMRSTLAGQATGETLQAIEQWRDVLSDMVTQFNAMGALSTAPLGIPSLTGRYAPAVPKGISPAVLNLENLVVAVVVILVMAGVGFLLGAVYLGLIAQRVRHDAWRLADLLRALPRYWMNLIGLALVGAAALLAAVLPFVFLTSCMWMVSPILGIMVMMIGLSVGLWVLIFMVFTVHAMMLLDRSLFLAIRESALVVRVNSGSTVLFLLLILGLYIGLGMVFGGDPAIVNNLQFLSFLEPESWGRVLGLLGHAFVTTSLVAATFIYFKDRYRHYAELKHYLEQHKL